VLLIQALSGAISNYKIDLVEREKKSPLNEPEQALHSFLQFSTSKLFIVAILGRIAAQVAGQPLPDLFAWKIAPSHFNSRWRTSLVDRWTPFVEALVPLIVSNIEGDAKDVVRSSDDLASIARKVGLQIQSLRGSYESVMSPIRDVTSV
jgi:hypothetical protein